MSSSRPRRTRASRPPPDDLDLLSDTLFGPSHGERHDTRRDRARGLGPLCREVERTLAYALAAAGDARLRDLMVICVTPAPHAGRLAVLVAPPSPVDIDERRELLAQLDRARGRLRAELASVLQRKRTPELAFMLADDEGGEP
jgi:ribosome-binding factor A